MKNKKLIIAAIALVAVAAIFLGVFFATRPATSQGTKTFTVTVVHADGTSKDFTYSTDEEYLGAVLEAEGLIAGTDSEFGLMIDTVDGERAVWEESGAFWAMYVGEEYAMTGADTNPVNDGDTFKLVYTLG